MGGGSDPGVSSESLSGGVVGSEGGVVAGGGTDGGAAGGGRGGPGLCRGGEGGGTWWVDVADGSCVVTREHEGQSPDVRIRSDAETWVELAKGNRSRLGAVLRRRLRVKGDRRKAAQFARLFG